MDKIVILVMLAAYYLAAAQLERNDESQTIFDRSGALVWEDDIGSASIKSSYKNALSYCENLRLDGSKEWRLPSAKELSEILDKSRTPTINQIFRHSASGGYWCKIDKEGSVTWIDFSDGETYRGSGIDRYLFVRCVREQKQAIIKK